MVLDSSPAQGVFLRWEGSITLVLHIWFCLHQKNGHSFCQSCTWNVWLPILLQISSQAAETSQDFWWFFPFAEKNHVAKWKRSWKLASSWNGHIKVTQPGYVEICLWQISTLWPHKVIRISSTGDAGFGLYQILPSNKHWAAKQFCPVLEACQILMFHLFLSTAPKNGWCSSTAVVLLMFLNLRTFRESVAKG